MFGLIGKVVARFWPVVLAVWGALVVLGWLFAPDWDAVTQTGEANFLPADSASRRGEQFFREAFPEGYSGSNVAVVLRREAAALTGQDRRFIEEELTPRLWKLAEDSGGQESIVGGVRTLDQPGTGALLVSP